MNLAHVNKFLATVCASDTAFFRLFKYNICGTDGKPYDKPRKTSLHYDFSLPLTQRDFSKLCYLVDFFEASVGIVANAVKRTPKDPSKPHGTSDWEYVYRSFVPELDAADISPEQQLSYWHNAGLPLSWAVFTGGKSVHPYVVFDTPVSQMEWAQACWGILTRYAKAAGVSQESNAFDASCLNVGQAYKVPGFKHLDTRKLAVTLEAPELPWYSPLELSEFASSLPEALDSRLTKVKGKRNVNYVSSASDLETLQKLADEYIAIAGHTSQAWFTAVDAKVSKKLETIERGKNAPTAVWSASCMLGLLPTVADYNASMAISYVLQQLEQHFSKQNTSRGYEWNAEEYKQQVINGLIDGLQVKLAEVAPYKRQLLNTEEVNMKYISEANLGSRDEKLLFVRSPIGTGKTRAIVEYINSCSEGERMISICHRRMLDDNWENTSVDYKLGFTSYADEMYMSNWRNFTLANTDRLSVVIDSLWKTYEDYARDASLATYGLVVLDEASQLLHHLFTSDNTPVNKHRRLTVDLLRLILVRAKKVIICDADLSDLEVNIIKQLAQSESYVAIDNTHKPFSKHFCFVKDEPSLELLLSSKLEQGNRCYVALDNAAKASQLAQRLENAGKSVLLVTGDTVDDVREQYSNKSQMLELLTSKNCTIATQALGTGVDIAVGNGDNTEDEPFDYVFGIFSEPDYSTFNDCLQALGRPRYPKSNNVFVYCHEYVNFSPTSAKVIRKLKKLKQESIVPTEIATDVDLANADIISFKKPEHSFITDWQELYLSRKAEEGINRLGKMQLSLAANGHVISCYLNDKSDSELKAAKVNLSGAKKQAKDQVRSDKCQAIVEAKVLSYDEVQKLLTKGKSNKEQKHQLQRYFISKKTATEELTNDLVHWYLYEGGEQSCKLELLANKCSTEAFLDDKQEVLERGVNGGYGASFHQDAVAVIQGLEKLLQPVISDSKYTAADLKEVHEFAQKHKATLEHKSIGLTVDKYPVRFVNKYLSLRGWETKEDKQTREGDLRDRVYELKLDQGLNDVLTRVKQTYINASETRENRLAKDKRNQEQKLKQIAFEANLELELQELDKAAKALGVPQII